MAQKVGRTRGLQNHLGANPYLLISMRLKCNHLDNILPQTAASKSAGKSELWPISQRHQNRPFFEILQRGDQGKMAQKVGRTSGAPKSPLAANLGLSSIN